MNAKSKDALEALSGSAWDVVVAGAGPAGAMAARELARLGAAVLLVDKSRFPRYKVCGCCLNGRALGALDAAGLGGLVERHGGVPLHTFELAAAGRSARMKLPRGAALSRAVFDAALADAAAAEGARFVPECRASLKEGTRDQWIVSLQRGEVSAEVSARIVLAADGLGQKLLNTAETFESKPAESARIGAGVMLEDCVGDFLPGVIYMAAGPGGYVGLVCVEGNRLNVAAALDPAAVREAGGPGPVAAAIVDESGLDAPDGLADANWRGTPGLTRRASRVSAHRFLVLGDAAGYVEPFTGEGMAWALSAGRAIAPIAHGALETFDETTERAWARRYRALCGRAQWRCRVIAAGLRRPGLVKAATIALGKMPALATPVIGRLNVGVSSGKEMRS